MELPITTITERLAEGNDYTYAPTDPLRYSDNTPVLEAHVNTFTVSLVDVATGTVMRRAENVFDDGGVIDGSGIFTLPITEQDTRAIGTSRFQERRLTFQLVTSAGVNKNWAIRFFVENLPEVP